jgi:hypothetical protein
MEPIAGRNAQIVKARSKINILEFSSRSLRHVRRYPFGLASGLQLLRATVSERLDHSESVTRNVTRGRRRHWPPDVRANLPAEAGLIGLVRDDSTTRAYRAYKVRRSGSG